MTLIQNFLPKNIKAYSGLTLSNLKAITLHWIGPYPSQTPDIVRNWWLTSGLEGSAHFIIKDEMCMQVWDTSLVAWHCGNSFGNRNTLGIEVIPQNVSGEFSASSIQTLKQILNTYFPNLPLCRHYDWTGKDCPKFYCSKDNWASLINILQRPIYNIKEG